EWFKSIGYLPANDIKIIYPGNGVQKIPMVYDAVEFLKDPVVKVDNLLIEEGRLKFSGYGFKPGVSIPYAQNSRHILKLTPETGPVLTFDLVSGELDSNLNVLGTGKLIYAGATFKTDTEILLLSAGKYKVSIQSEINTLSPPVGFEQTVKIEGVLPPVDNYLGRSYHFEKNASNELFLIIEDVELIIIKGDVNDDKLVDILDLVILSRHLAELQTLAGKNLLAADVNSDGFVDILDLVKISRILAELE
ncbi:MAG: hypothetical protein CVU96_06595, partial [Firmicutes bacterium HGW-Firmicutes-20]